VSQALILRPVSQALALPTQGAIATVDLGSGKRARQITAGCWHTCALLEDGDIKCWGLNNWGQVSLFVAADISAFSPTRS
jgi:alpha-tubulin suppressor-like RCC1 family protein